MKKERGLTLIELMIVLTCLGIIAAVAVPHFQDQTFSNKDDTYCKAGYLFLFSQNGHSKNYQDRQMIGANGGGIPCLQ